MAEGPMPASRYRICTSAASSISGGESSDRMKVAPLTVMATEPATFATPRIGYLTGMAAKARPPKKWSRNVTETSDAMDVADGTFTSDDPVKIARAVEKDAETSNRRKSTPYRSAMSMLTFYINRAGSKLTGKHRQVLEDAKDVLREQFGPKTSPKPKRIGVKKKTVAAKRTPAKRRKAKAKSASG